MSGYMFGFGLLIFSYDLIEKLGVFRQKENPSKFVLKVISIDKYNVN